MSTAAEPTKEKEGGKVSTTVAPWGIEADHPRNSDLAIQAIPGCKLRGGIKASRTVKDAKSGEEMVPLDQSRHLGQLPSIPGMQLHINPTKCTYKIVDPLYGDEALCERIGKRIQASSLVRGNIKLAGIAPQDGKLDVHRMKTLCREMLNIVDAGEATIVSGPKPSRDDVDNLPGRYLLNPGSRVESGQPLFEDELEAYRQKVNQRG